MAARTRLAFACIVIALSCFFSSAHAQRAPDDKDIERQVREFIDRIKSYPMLSLTDKAGLGGLAALLAQGDALVKTEPGYLFFQRREDIDAIERLMQMVLIKDRDIRVLSTRVLINVVDYRTLCVVLDRLVTTQMVENDDARVNTLLIIRDVMKRDNKFNETNQWTITATNRLKAMLAAAGDKDQKLTGHRIDQILKVITEVGNPLQLDSKHVDACKKLKNFVLLNSPLP